jgi:hypothetical protein
MTIASNIHDQSTNASISKYTPSQPCTAALEPPRSRPKIMKFEKRYKLNVELSGNIVATLDWTMDHPQVQSYPYGDILDGLERPSGFNTAAVVRYERMAPLIYIQASRPGRYISLTNPPHSCPLFPKFDLCLFLFTASAT